MSRFVLRSKEGTKLPEQKDKLKPPSNASRTPTKKVENRKSRTNISSKDSIELVSSPQQPSSIDEDEEEKSSHVSSHVSIICSLPLSRLTGIIEKLSIKPPSSSPSPSPSNSVNPNDNVFTKPNHNLNLNGANSIHDDDDKEKDQEERQSLIDDDTSNSKSQDQSLLIKILCLYCDKKFSTHKMQQKHIEKFHIPLKDRRCSVRNSQVQTTTTSPRKSSKLGPKSLERTSSSVSASASITSVTSNLASTNFPGCSYCKKNKSLEIAESSSAVDFNGLFLHLTEHHADKYFGCKICVMRFQNIAKLLKHMQNVHNTLPDAQLKLTKDYNDTQLDESNIEPMSPVERHTRTKQRPNAQRESPTLTMSVLDSSSVIGAEEAILSRLGLTQNRRRNPSNRKGVRLRRDTNVPEILLKSDIISPGISSASLVASPLKSRSRVTAKSTNSSNDTDSVVFRVPARTDSQLAAFDESFYKEVTSNVRKNLLYHLDGKLGDRNHILDEEPAEHQDTKSLPLLLRGTLASSVTIQENFDSNLQDSEIHVATNIPATTAFPTLLTAEQYCVDVTLAKIRRPHTKHSWKWKWDSVKKYKLINEGGKIVKKAKHPMLGLRDLSKLDMWTQLSMRQKHEKQLSLAQYGNNAEECYSIEKRRLNDQLNSILDTRVLPHIILEQSEQAIIKLENDEFNFSSNYERHDEGDDFYTGNIVDQTFADEGFLSLLQLSPKSDKRLPERKLVLSGEWARPRCYLCMCCGNKFEKLKSLEEHKMFRHPNILSTHYEVVGRELLAGNILQHLFIPKRALSIYSNISSNPHMGKGNSKSLVSYRRVNTSAEEESSDSVQSITNCYTTQRTYQHQNINSTTDDCDTDTKTTLLDDMNTISPSHSLQSSFSSSNTPTSSLSQNLQKQNRVLGNGRKLKCSKCNRKCNSLSDLYRHMLDCSGDYIWSMAKKRKYRYYCGSKKRRPLHKQHLLESRRSKPEKPIKNPSVENCTTEESSSNSYKTKTPPKPRPSDAESIKKMLENLPPKRICKKIFPTVNKTRKARKPAFITKLYNTKVLRKTRARQISNAAKRAAGARFSGKSQMKNNALKTLRSKTTKNSNRLKSSNRSSSSSTSTTVPGNITCKDSQSDKPNDPKNDNNDSEEQKKELKKSENHLESGIEVKSNVPEEKQSENKEEGILLECTNSTKTPEKEERSTELCETKGNAKEATEPADKNETTTAVPLVPLENVKETPKTQQQTENQACNRKRSKRISDCIAMLTGKLEEKLKTELTVTSKNNETACTESKTTSIEIEKKTPKRKAISRRIIKPDINDTTSTELDHQSKSVIPTTVPPILTATLTTSKRVSTTKEMVTTTAAKTPTTVPIASISQPIMQSTKISMQKTLLPPLPLPVPPVSVQIQPTTVAIPIQPAAISLPITVPPTLAAPTKLLLPNAIAPSAALVSIPISIASTLHAVPVPLKVLQNHLPVFLPVQQNLSSSSVPSSRQPPAPAPPPPPPSLRMTAPTTTNATSGVIPTVALLPPPPLLQAHVSQNLSSNAPNAMCSNTEPLNLSNAKGPKKQTTAELRAQRPGMPARRQTICGFEAREMLFYNDMEPLDLSKKSKEPPAPTKGLTYLPPSLQVSQIPQPPQPQQQPQPVKQAAQLSVQPTKPPVELLPTIQTAQMAPQAESASKPVNMIIPSTLPPETIFNKQFYSNLDLLKIPQVRAAGFAPTNLSANETVTTMSNGPSINTLTTTNPNPVTVAPKINNKKRNNSKAGVEQNTVKPTTNSGAGTPSKVKENANSNKKENSAKNKPILKMDEEVINHIDDAINSVINAVKASLPENDDKDEVPPPIFAMKLFEAKNYLEDKPVENLEKPLEKPIVNKENNTPAVPQIILTPKKRTLRSKTMDCRSELMCITRPASRTEILYSPITQFNNIQPMDENMPNGISNIKESKPDVPKEKKNEIQNPNVMKEDVIPPAIVNEPLVATTADGNALEQTKEELAEKTKEKTPEKLKEKLENTKQTVVEQTKEKLIEKVKEKPEKRKEPVVEKSKEKLFENGKQCTPGAINTDSEKETLSTTPSTAIEKKLRNDPISLESNHNLIVEENMSNINNTSSGFHSSGTPENGTGDVKKKQRRRRKNELAAIVADQLLESFKIDKARRDSLKKLENLAYEKSEDLLLTGMLLMSSTKRNASSGISFTQNANDKRAETTKRQKQEAITPAQAPKTRGKTNENSTKNNQLKEEVNEITPRKSKRRQSRRKTTPLDNENLSKLKSSLESFSIGIEKQLSEIEARNMNVFNNTENKSRKNGDQSLKSSSSYILRPSILSATLEQADTQKNVTADSNKASTFSRDPRLNKNIHKDEQQIAIPTNEKNIEPVGEIEDDNYLTEIAKNVNEKIMSAENEDFAFADDGFEIGNEFQDDSNSKFSRPPTSMSVCSAPNFNDDRSNFGSICDENTNTEVMDMDLDDELSVYTSFSQDLGRGRGRKRRRRRSILLKRRPKKRRSSQDMAAEKFECELCKKTFFAATSLAKHNMTLAHVSKVSEREYLMSKTNKTSAMEEKITSKLSPKPPNHSQSVAIDVVPNQCEKILQMESVPQIILDSAIREPIKTNNVDTSHRLSLNPDERLFFECCNILKSADTSRVVRGDNDIENQNSFAYLNTYKNQKSCDISGGRESTNINDGNLNLLQKPLSDPKARHAAKTTQDAFRNPIAVPNSFNKLSTIATTANERQINSPTYSQFSAVTNTTSRFKTKAAMKGYENGNVHITMPDESKSRATCKLTELADIALGHDDKPRTPEIAPNLDQAIIGTAKRVVTPEYVTLSVVDGRRNCNYNAVADNKKNTETQGSSSSRTIMHSSIIKAAVEEHSKPQPVNKIIIPERPFKNIGLEEKESITFQKPKTTVNLLLDDNSISTASYSDRDDFDFGSMSCDDEISDKTINDKILKSNSSDSSSSRATAKTFENKSLIMGRIFKNASTKPKAPVKNIGIQKDHPPKADLNQLFDELRGEGVPKPKTVDTFVRKEINISVQEAVYQEPKLPPPVIPSPEQKRKSKPADKKPKVNKKPKKDYTKLRSELGMSQEDIDKFIDDGQRKSKRRCATNRSKKMVEMWSSDEYEEFLSTKDIIALIEEKEKQEQRKKRKNTAIANNMEAEKEVTKTPNVMNKITTSTNRKSSRSQLNAEDKNVEEQKTAAPRTSSKSRTKDKDKLPKNLLANESSRKSNTWMKPTEESTNTSRASKSQTRKIKNTRQSLNKGGHKNANDMPEKNVIAANEEALGEAVPPLLGTIPALEVSEDNQYLLDVEQNQNNNNTYRNNKTKKDKSAKDDVNSFKSPSRETNKEVIDSKKRNISGNSSNKKNKGKRKQQTEKSPIRKRQATEKLYYWSSSSDEDFGRINDNEPEFENTEQYQKHGWIVGDSHKKLVTLLAIAKGNKKVESCGVKKKVSKRKS